MVLVAVSTSGADGAVPGAQIVAEPRDHQRCACDRGHHGFQPIERDQHVGGLGHGVDVLGRAVAGTAGSAHDAGGIGELVRGQNDGPGLDQPLGGIRIIERAKHLEGKLRQAVAETRERQFLEHHIGRAAIGRRGACAHLRFDERVRHLRLIARIPAPGHAREIHDLAIGPGAADAGDRAFTKADRETGEIAVFGGGDLRSATLAAALAGGAHFLAEVRGSDDVAPHAHAAVEARDHHALGGRGLRRLSMRAPSMCWPGIIDATIQPSTISPGCRSPGRRASADRSRYRCIAPPVGC